MFRWPFRNLKTIVSLALAMTLWGCSGGGSSTSTGTSSLSSPPEATTNLVFLVSPDLAHNGGDVNPSTANLSNQGLQRALEMATYVKTSILASANPHAIYALEPCTHLQTAHDYPDVVPLEILEQFALLNQYPLLQTPPTPPLLEASFPINVSYTAASLPAVAETPPGYFPCQGIDFADHGSGNETLVNSLLAQQPGGFYVFAMPFDTLQSLLARLKSMNAYGYNVPDAWAGPNTLYVLSVSSHTNSATLNAYDTHIQPGTTYPTPAFGYQPAANQQAPFTIQPATLSGASPPPGINTSQTVYFVRHGEAHPTSHYEDGNMVMQGNWRALYLPGALATRINQPDAVYSVDPAQAGPGMPANAQVANTFYSYVRPSMTVAPYSIANGLPLQLASGFQCFGLDPADDAIQVEKGVDFFFTQGQFTGKTLLVGWEHVHIQQIAQALMNRYFLADPSQAPTVPAWPGDSLDYDTIWTFTLDGNGNLTVDNLNCEGIKSSTLPSTAPTFLKNGQ